MNDILQQLIRLSVEFEGNLRVCAARDSAEAMSSARDKFDRMAVLMAALTPKTTAEMADKVKEDEAVGAETTPEPEPDEAEAPADVPVAESDATAVEAAKAAAEQSEEDPAEEIKIEVRREGPSGDLRKSFTLNDKFLFRRELFNGHEQEFEDTLDLIQTMQTYDEAVEYLIEDLQWDADSAVVKDFLAVVASYFK